MDKVKIIFPDGKPKEFKKGVTGLEIAQFISVGLAREALAIKVDEHVWDLSKPINHDAAIKILTFKDPEGVEVFRHSTAHIMADAVTQLFPYAKPTIGPAVDEGFYYDFDHEPFKTEDMERIEKKMQEIIKQDLKFERKEISKKEALKLFKDNQYKVEMIKELKEDAVTVYQHGKYVDFCRGPHVQHTGQIKAVKLTKIAGAYWRGDAKNKMLQRIYGISFPDKKELKAYLDMLEEAKRRDHRIIGKNMDLFEVFEEVGPGLIFWLPKGNIIKEELENWAKETEKEWGYTRITTPIITKEGLFHTSEHLPHYQESMYAPMKIDNENYYIKPMNCPFHHMAYKARKKSYRDLPLRYAEYGWCHRYEDSGALTGLLRVRGMMMNDSHIYCTKEQAINEFVDVIKLHQYYYNILGIKEYWMELCLRNPDNKKYHGDETMWKEAEELMVKAMDISGVKYTVQNDGAAFYGPKVDFQIKSVIGRVFTASTNQIDLFMPKKFGLAYTAEDGREYTPAVIHRAPLGTHERFIGFLIEHFGGRFPLWLSPVQVRILSVTDRSKEYVEKLKEKMLEHELRVEIDIRNESIPKKVRDAQLQQANYILVVGEKEMESKTVTPRTRDGKVEPGIEVNNFIERLVYEIKEKRL